MADILGWDRTLERWAAVVRSIQAEVRPTAVEVGNLVAGIQADFESDSSAVVADNIPAVAAIDLVGLDRTPADPAAVERLLSAELAGVDRCFRSISCIESNIQGTAAAGTSNRHHLKLLCNEFTNF